MPVRPGAGVRPGAEVIDEAAQVIAVTLLHKAYEHLPPERVAGAVNLANTEPMARAIKAMVLEAATEGMRRGNAQGRAELEKEMEDDWRPVAERIRAQANSPSYSELERRMAAVPDSGYTGGPVAVW